MVQLEITNCDLKCSRRAQAEAVRVYRTRPPQWRCPPTWRRGVSVWRILSGRPARASPRASQQRPFPLAAAGAEPVVPPADSRVVATGGVPFDPGPGQALCRYCSRGTSVCGWLTASKNSSIWDRSLQPSVAVHAPYLLQVDVARIRKGTGTGQDMAGPDRSSSPKPSVSGAG